MPNWIRATWANKANTTAAVGVAVCLCSLDLLVMRAQVQTDLPLDDCIHQQADDREHRQGGNALGFLQPHRANRCRVLDPAKARFHRGILILIGRRMSASGHSSERTVVARTVHPLSSSGLLRASPLPPSDTLTRLGVGPSSLDGLDGGGAYGASRPRD